LSFSFADHESKRTRFGSIADQAPAHLTVRLGALVANYREAARRAAPAMVAPVVKADAYRVGMVPVAQALASDGRTLFLSPGWRRGSRFACSRPGREFSSSTAWRRERRPRLSPIV